MTVPFTIQSAHAVRPCVRAHGASVIFSAVFPGSGEHGLQLIHVPDGETVYIPLTDEHRIGNVYSVCLTPFQTKEWLYRYKNQGIWIPDPHALSVCRTFLIQDGERKTVTACGCHPLQASALLEDGPENPLPPADWSEQVIYGLHVRGFTYAMPEGTKGRGTFAGAAAQIPYLKELGVTAVELMPVYLPLPDLKKNKKYRTMEEALGAWPVSHKGDPLRDMKERPNYWGFGRGLYYALRPSYGTQEEFAAMVRAFHKARIRVLLQICFEKGIHISEQIEILQFYVARYGIDGFRLLGNIPCAGLIAQTPSLSDIAFFYHSFPFQEMEEEREAARISCETDLDSLPVSAGETDPDSLPVSAGDRTGRMEPAACDTAPRSYPRLVTSGSDFQTLLRRFVKSDDYVMKDFLKLFLAVPVGHGELRSVTGYDGFTLADLVSYNERHNTANGEFGLDGTADNYSWNCGEEGPTDDPQILSLRRKQIRNFLTLLFLSQGTPLLRQGDERYHTQDGNNNPYCQDNEISWIDWTPSAERERLTAFTAKLAAFRKKHPVFHSHTPFQYIDSLGIGHPDVSLHGEQAWQPDLGPYSHSIGIAYCEDYVTGRKTEPFVGRAAGKAFVYLAVNMYWKELSLALPRLPVDYVWKVVMDTENEEGFSDTMVLPADRHYVTVAPRSIRILLSFYDPEACQRYSELEAVKADDPAGDGPETDCPEEDVLKADDPARDAPETDCPEEDVLKADDPARDAPGTNTPEMDDAAKDF